MAGFESVIGWLGSGDARAMSHAELEDREPERPGTVAGAETLLRSHAKLER